MSVGAICIGGRMYGLDSIDGFSIRISCIM